MSESRSTLIERLRRLTEAYGPSGREDSVRALIESEIRPYADEVRVDALGNLIARRAPRGVAGGQGTGRRVLVAAHMDEIGLIVTHIDDDGFLRLEPVGGHDAAVLVGQRVRFENGVIGTIGTEKIEDAKDLKLAKLFIDIGARSGAEAREKVRIGDMAVFHRPLERAGDRLVAKAMDDRSGCAVVIEAMSRLESSPHEVFFVFTVQEEVGLRGARTAAYGIEPDVAVAVDITVAGDTPEPAHRIDVKLGRGPAVKIKDMSVISHRLVRDWMTKAAEREGIPYQYEVLPFGGNDAGAMQLARAGVPSGTLSIPCRYPHTPGEMVDAQDLENAVRLLVAMLEGPVG